MKPFNKETIVDYVNEALKIRNDEVIVLYACGNYKVMGTKDFNSSDLSVIHHIKGNNLNLYFNIPKKQLKNIGADYINKYPAEYTRVLNTVSLRANQAMTLLNA